MSIGFGHRGGLSRGTLCEGACARGPMRGALPDVKRPLERAAVAPGPSPRVQHGLWDLGFLSRRRRPTRRDTQRGWRVHRARASARRGRAVRPDEPERTTPTPNTRHEALLCSSAPHAHPTRRRAPAENRAADTVIIMLIMVSLELYVGVVWPGAAVRQVWVSRVAVARPRVDDASSSLSYSCCTVRAESGGQSALH